MSDPITVTENVTQVTVVAGETLQIVPPPAIEVIISADGGVTVLEQPPITVTVEAADEVTVTEDVISVIVGGADHPSSHPLTGSEHTLSGLTPGDVLTALTPTSAGFSAALHGTPAGDLHTGYALLAGRAGGQTLIGGSAASEILSLQGTAHATPGLVQVKRSVVTASAGMLRGLIGAEANPRWQFGFSSGSLIELGLGAGGATAMDLFLRRTATRALRLVSTIATLPPTFGGLTSTDTQPRWMFQTRFDSTLAENCGTVSMGVGGATAPDTHIRRFVDPGYALMPDVMVLPNLVTPPAPTVASGEPEIPLYLYGRAPSGASGTEPKLFTMAAGLGGFIEVGPIGTLRGLLRRINLQQGGMEVFNGNGEPALAGVSMWGLLGAASATMNTTIDAAYSPALSLTNNITATETLFAITGGLPLVGDVIVIGTEKIQVIQVSTPSGEVTGCLRGAYGTTAAAHTAADPILLAGAATRTLLMADGEPALEQTTTTSSGTDAAISYPSDTGFACTFHCEQLLIYKLSLRDITSLRMFVGFTDQTKATMIASDNPAGNYWGIQFSTARGDIVFQTASKDGVTQLVQPTDWTPLANIKYYLVLEKAGGADPTASLFNTAWGQIGSTFTMATYPVIDSSGLRIVAGIRNTAAVSRRIRHIFASYNISPGVA